MNDSVNTLVPAVAAVIVLVVGITAAIKPQRISPGVLWWVPALLSAAFFVGSLRAIATGGSLGFWAEHIRNDWNNQIFLDLLLSASCAYFLLLTRARAVSMHLLAWFMVIATTGSIGLLAMIARVLFLERSATIKTA